MENKHMKSIGKFLFLSILFVGLCGCESSTDCIEYRLYIENHSDDRDISLRTGAESLNEQCTLAPHEMICVKERTIVSSKTDPVLGSSNETSTPEAHLHQSILQDKVFENLYINTGDFWTEEDWVKVEDTEDSPYRGCNYKYDASMSYGNKKCFVYQITVE